MNTVINLNDIKTFAIQNKTLCILTLGLAILSLSFSILGRRVVAWIYEPIGTTKKTDSVAHANLNPSPQQSPQASPQEANPPKKPDNPKPKRSSIRNPNDPTLGKKVRFEGVGEEASSTENLSEIPLQATPETPSTPFDPNFKKEIQFEPWNTNLPASSLIKTNNQNAPVESSFPSPIDSKKEKEIPFLFNFLEIEEPQVRKIPPISIADSVIYIEKELQSIHGNGTLFSDEEIIEKLDIIKRIQLKDEIYAEYTKHGKAIIQQQATRGCTAAAAAMLIMDNGKKVDVDKLLYRNIGVDERILEDIKKAGLNPTLEDPFTLTQLEKLIQKNGSAIVTLNKKLGSHVVVVDEISEELGRVRLRDPYHGWEITVTEEAFLKEWNRGEVIQIPS